MFTPRKTAILSTTSAACALAMFSAAPAQAATTDTIWNLGYRASASITVKASGQSASTTGFVFSSYNLNTHALSSSVMLNSFKMPVMLGKMRIAWATVVQEPVGKATGSVNASTHMISQSQKVNLHITDVSMTGHGLINYVGDSCRTSTPVTMNLSGKMGGLFDPITLKGTYTIPNFSNCGIATSMVNKQVAGQGNTISLKLTPQG